MNTVENETFQNKAVTVDGIEFKGCLFENSALVYNGGELPSFIDCQFNGITLKFSDAAANTLDFLSGLRKGGFAPAVDKIVNEIRKRS